MGIEIAAALLLPPFHVPGGVLRLVVGISFCAAVSIVVSNADPLKLFRFSYEIDIPVNLTFNKMLSGQARENNERVDL